MRNLLYIGNIERDLIKNLVNAHFKKKFKFESSVTMGEVVESICSKGTYDIYFIDVDFKDLEPGQLWGDIADLGGERPVIFIGSKHILNTRLDLNSYEGKENVKILERPVQVDQFKLAMEQLIELMELSELENNTIDATEEEFFPMKLRSFYLHSRISFDAYARITHSKYLKVIGRDQRYTISFLQTYLRKGVKCLYLKKDERLKMLETSVDQCKTILAMPDITFKKALIIQGVGIGLVHEYIRLLGVTNHVLELSTLIGENVRRFNRSVDFIKEIISTIDVTNKTIEARSILTAYIADSLLLAMGWSADLTRKKLSLAAIIHDASVNDDQLSHCLSLEEPFVKRMVKEEIDNYKNHPNKSSEIARHFTDVPDVDFIVEQHHENPRGLGFPRKMSGLQVTALSAVFGVAVQFSTYVTLLGTNTLTLRKILGKLKDEMNQGNFRPGIKALEDVLRSL